MSLRGYRKKRRPGNRAMTKAEAAHVTEAKLEGQCSPCLSWSMQGCMPVDDVAQGGDWDHKKHAGLRRGHGAGFLSCKWHHMGHPGEGWTAQQMRAHFGPSLMDGSKLFTRAYGSDDYLIGLQGSAA